ncbi:hypothetical protein GW17_00024536 [Ensete ventricosum]|nr:hypothetical protein GW17_00024536 [Ensete ventricosum]
MAVIDPLREFGGGKFRKGHEVYYGSSTITALKPNLASCCHLQRLTEPYRLRRANASDRSTRQEWKIRGRGSVGEDPSPHVLHPRKYTGLISTQEEFSPVIRSL